MNTTHAEAARHALSGHLNPKRFSAGVPLFGNYTIQFSQEFSGALVLERSLNNGPWSPVETFVGETIASHTYKRFEGTAGASFRFSGEKLRSLVGYKLFDGE
jgi:hypothetical protein